MKRFGLVLLTSACAKDGFEATRYTLATDQLDTQLDPPAHWNPDYPGIDELPPTFARSSSSPSSTPFVRFFACQEDCSNEAPDTLVPVLVASGAEPFLVVGAMAGG